MIEIFYCLPCISLEQVDKETKKKKYRNKQVQHFWGSIATLVFDSFHSGFCLANCMVISGETLCRDNCQLIGMPYFHTHSAGKNNRN